jgi:hypothetical protein
MNSAARASLKSLIVSMLRLLAVRADNTPAPRSAGPEDPTSDAAGRTDRRRSPALDTDRYRVVMSLPTLIPIVSTATGEHMTTRQLTVDRRGPERRNQSYGKPVSGYAR